VYAISQSVFPRKELLKYRDLIVDFAFSTVRVLVTFILDHMETLVHQLVVEDQEIQQAKAGRFLFLFFLFIIIFYYFYFFAMNYQLIVPHFFLASSFTTVC
jgi:hypothetical protein